MSKVCLISLGCPKNVVDAEEILGEVEKAGHEIEADPSAAEVLIVNTCGFIQSAKEESIDAVLDAVRYKTNGACRSVIVTGCLAQRYGQQLAGELPEADAFLGLSDSRRIAETITRTLDGNKTVEIGEPGSWWTKTGNRVLSTSPWTSYLRVADGCDNRCTYCAIPGIRGGFRSRSEQDILSEAGALADSGVKELNLVAQDITRFGMDTDGRQRLPWLMDKLAAIEGIRWIRLLYCYPTLVSSELIETIASNEKVCNYIDIPLQQCSDRILRMMGREGSKREYLDLFARIAERIPEAALRTTFIVGFPGETEEDFEEMVDFVREVKFDRMGIFPYSSEEDTPAARLPGKVGKSTVERRCERLMEVQHEISLEKNKGLIAKEMEVLIESIDGGSAVGRSYRDAPEIDGVVRIENAGNLEPGDFASVIITDASEHDLIGNPVNPRSAVLQSEI